MTNRIGGRLERSQSPPAGPSDEGSARARRNGSEGYGAVGYRRLSLPLRLKGVSPGEQSNVSQSLVFCHRFLCSSARLRNESVRCRWKDAQVHRPELRRSSCRSVFFSPFLHGLG